MEAVSAKEIVARREQMRMLLTLIIHRLMIPQPSHHDRMLTGTSWPAMIRVQDAERYTRKRIYRNRDGHFVDSYGVLIPVVDFNQQTEVHPYSKIQGNM